MSADRNLLVGILALQLNFVTRDQLVEGMHAWVLDKGKPLGEVFVARGAMDAEQFKLLSALVDKHIEKNHGDIQKSFQQLSSVDPEVTLMLASIEDADVDATVQYIPCRQTNGDRSRTDRSRSRFRIIRPHAKGGLGEVYVAEDTELSRTVALKEIQERFADDTDRRERFLREAEITGRLEHPGIVPVYGLGTYDNGRPFYAMKFVKGDSLKDAIDKFHADPSTMKAKSLMQGEVGIRFRELLGRFIDVCNAVHYAHSRGVLHRDLKPGNIMIGEYGETLVVDWGLAKILGEQLSPDSDRTALEPASGSGATPTIHGIAIGTPAYMSPEQAMGKVNELASTSDVYSLGGTLYYLLCGRVPYNDHNAEALLNSMRVNGFPKPSSHTRSVPKALEAVCEKAMSFTASERYSSPLLLATEIQTFLADESIEAYAEPLTSRARRWIRHHPGFASTVFTCSSLGLLALLLVVQLQSRYATILGENNKALSIAKSKAEEHRRVAIDAVKKFANTISQSRELKNSVELDALRTELLNQPLDFFDRLRKDLQLEPDPSPQSLVLLAKALFELGKLNAEIGSKKDAIVAYREAIDVLESKALAALSNDVDGDLAKTCINLGNLLVENGSSAESKDFLDRAIALYGRLSAAFPDRLDLRIDEAGAYSSLGRYHMLVGQLSEAGTAYENARRKLEEQRSSHPDNPDLQLNLALIFRNLSILKNKIDDQDKAIELAKDTIKLLLEVSFKSPQNTQIKSSLAATYDLLGVLYRHTDQIDLSLESYEASIKVGQELVDQNPTNTLFRSNLATSLNNLGVFYGKNGNFDQEHTYYERAKAIQKQLVDAHPTNTKYLNELARTYSNLGFLLRDRNMPEEALENFRDAERIRKELVSMAPDFIEYLGNLGDTYYNISCMYTQDEDLPTALELVLSAIKYQELALARNPDDSTCRASQNSNFERLLFVGKLLKDSASLQRARLGLTELARSDRSFEEIDERIKFAQLGQDVKDPKVLLEMASRSHVLRRYEQASHFFKTAMEFDLEQNAEKRRRYVYNISCCLALAGNEEGFNAETSEHADELFNQAFDLLTKELDQFESMVQSGKPDQIEIVVNYLKFWQSDTSLSCVRDNEFLEEFPESQRFKWRALWQRVRHVLKQAQAVK